MPKTETKAVALRRSSRFKPQELAPKIKYYKLLAADLVHHGFQYKEGLNIDPVPFNPRGECEPGGLYYTDLKHLPLWYEEKWPMIADVTIPAGASVYAEPCGKKWKADRIELSNIRPLKEFLATLDDATLYEMVDKRPGLFVHVENQTEAMCLMVVKQCPLLLQNVKRQTKAICMAAINDCWNALQFVRKQNNDICLAAVHIDGRALKYVRRQNADICRAALRWYPEARQFVNIPIDF
jgi:hypothetical protein